MVVNYFMKRFFINLSDNKVNLLDSFNFVFNKHNGAVVTFTGSIRSFNNLKKVKGITYDIFCDLSFNFLNEICRNLILKYSDLYIYVHHVKGFVVCGEISVIVSVSSAHRNRSFFLCKYIIDSIKYKIPIWKLEHYFDGGSKWNEGNSLL